MSSNFSDTLMNITIKRSGIFAIKKLILGIFIYWLFIRMTQLWIFRKLIGTSFDFFISDFLKIVICSLMIDSIKGLVYMRYENNASVGSSLMKIALEPNVETFFIFVNSLLVAKIFYTLDSNACEFKYIFII
jgi:hypothetical protein